MSQAVTQTPHSHGAVVPAASRAEQFASFDVEAFEVPGGREEVWRFTPMKRLRGLHDGTAVAEGDLSVAVDGADVTVETVGRDDARLGQGGTPAVRNDQASRRSDFCNRLCQDLTIRTRPVRLEPGLGLVIGGE